jgi:signal transduction histidine kinase
MLDTINDIIEFSRIESGFIDLDFRDTYINEQIEYVYNFFKRDADIKCIGFSIKNPLSFEESLIKTDSKKLFIILSNLVKNAIKFTDFGTVELGYIIKPDVIEFFVKDTGIGIPLDRQKAIFERFIQADIEDKKAHQGSGLGLSIAKSYVDALGGKIWLESTPGKGSSFYFTIPRSTLQVKNLSNIVVKN